VVMKDNFTPSFIEEKMLWDQNMSHVIGIDEVGVGAFAGPVVVAGVIFDTTCENYFLDATHELYKFFNTIHDSKKLLPKVREMLVPLIQKSCLFHAVSEISVPVINSIGIRKATFQGMQDVIKKMLTYCHYDKSKIALLVDGFLIPDVSHPQKALVKGDQKSISIAAASIIAKVHRDSLMQELAKKYPAYVFDKNKGYGTKEHREAIQNHGLCDIHRSSFHLTKFL
jgi:ribonuclease HII